MTDVERVRAASPLAQIVGDVTELCRSGDALVGACPLHDDEDPSFHVYGDGDGGFFCYGCQVGGDVFTFVMRHQGIGFVEALEYLAGRAGVTLNGSAPDPELIAHRDRLERQVSEARRRLLSTHREYLQGRGLTDETIDRLRIGVTSRGEYLLPVLRHGRPVYLIRHDPNGSPKYLFPKGEARPLVGAERLGGDGPVYVVEGYFDHAVMVQAGFRTVALLGSPTKAHTEALARADDVVLLLDGDDAGRKAGEGLARDLYPAASLARLPDGMDPADLEVDQGDGFELEVRRLTSQAVDALDLQLAAFTKSTDPGDLAPAYDLVARLPVDSTDEDVAVGKIHEAAKAHGVRKGTIRADVERARRDALKSVLQAERARTKAERPTPERLLHLGRSVLEADDQLALVRERLRRDYYFAGDTSAAELLWLVLHSRHLGRPVNTAVHAPSAAGKSFTVETVAALHPADATYDLTSSSERALIYSDEDLRHRYIVVAEAAGLHRDGIGATIIRELAWGGRGIRYETVEKVDGGLKARVIEKPGPTGLITTTTKDLDPEVATRLLRITVTDSPTQTREVFRSLARKAERASMPDPNVKALHAAARWLASEGETRVVVPYATRLAELVPSDDVRLRRDFEQILTVVRVHAFVHQRRRDRTDSGAVVSSETDYRAAHRLLAGVLAVTLDDVTDAVRETVAAVEELTADLGDDAGVSGRELADHLGLSPSAVSYRVKQAGGYLVNREKRSGYPAQYRLGEPLPAARPILPDPTELFTPSESFEPSNAPRERGGTTGRTPVRTPVETGGPVQSNTSPPSNTSSNGPLPHDDGTNREGVRTFEQDQGDQPRSTFTDRPGDLFDQGDEPDEEIRI